VSKIILNASPLILMLKSKTDDILPQLFDEILMPDVVLKEITASVEDKASKAIWIKSYIKTIESTQDPQVSSWDLGAAETAVISFALHNKEYRPVLDDAQAKTCCMSLGIHPLGTGAIFILAKEKGLIQSVRETLLLLRAHGMWISNSIIDLLSQKAGE
jgi:predicted nucleic acid-binding protein